MKSVQELRTKCARLVHDAPKEFASARRAFENMLPLLESDEIFSRNRGRLAILANEANKGINESRLLAIKRQDFLDFLSRRPAVALGIINVLDRTSAWTADARST